MSTLDALLTEARDRGHAIGTANPTGRDPGLTAGAVLVLCTTLPAWTYRDLITAWLHRRRIQGAFHRGWQEAVIAYERSRPARIHLPVLTRMVGG